MQLLAFREYPAIDAQTLVEFTGHERLFRGVEGSFLLHMSSEGQPVAEERVIWLSARDAISCPGRGHAQTQRHDSQNTHFGRSPDGPVSKRNLSAHAREFNFYSCLCRAASRAVDSGESGTKPRRIAIR
jgi:hypothetical protein